MKPGLVKATDLRPFGFVTFKDSAAAQHFVDWSPHKVPDATVEIIAKWKHRHSAIQFHQKLDEISHTDSLQFQKKAKLPLSSWILSHSPPQNLQIRTGKAPGRKTEKSSSDASVGILEPLSIDDPDSDVSLKILALSDLYLPVYFFQVFFKCFSIF